jgi:hypothetical protein
MIEFKNPLFFMAILVFTFLCFTIGFGFYSKSLENKVMQLEFNLMQLKNDLAAKEIYYNLELAECNFKRLNP